MQRWKPSEGAQAPPPVAVWFSFAQVFSDSLRPKSMLSSQTVCSQLRFEAGSVDGIPPYVPCLVRCESLLTCTPNLGLSMSTCKFLKSWRSLTYLLLSQERACLTLRKDRVRSRKKGILSASKRECLSKEPYSSIICPGLIICCWGS